MTCLETTSSSRHSYYFEVFIELWSSLGWGEFILIFDCFWRHSRLSPGECYSHLVRKHKCIADYPTTCSSHSRIFHPKVSACHCCETYIGNECLRAKFLRVLKYKCRPLSFVIKMDVSKWSFCIFITLS